MDGGGVAEIRSPWKRFAELDTKLYLSKGISGEVKYNWSLLIIIFYVLYVHLKCFDNT